MDVRWLTVFPQIAAEYTSHIQRIMICRQKVDRDLDARHGLAGLQGGSLQKVRGKERRWECGKDGEQINGKCMEAGMQSELPGGRDGVADVETVEKANQILKILLQRRFFVFLLAWFINSSFSTTDYHLQCLIFLFVTFLGPNDNHFMNMVSH